MHGALQIIEKNVILQISVQYNKSDILFFLVNKKFAILCHLIISTRVIIICHKRKSNSSRGLQIQDICYLKR